MNHILSTIIIITFSACAPATTLTTSPDAFTDVLPPMATFFSRLAGRFKPGPGTGAIGPDPAFDRAIGAGGHSPDRSSILGLDVDADGLPDVAFSALLTAGKTHAWMRQTADGFEAPQVVPSGDCFAAADLVGDPAWDLVCALPRLHLVEGYMRAGETGIDWTRTHPIADPALPLDRVEGITVRDLDRDGRSDLAVASFWFPAEAPSRTSYVFWNDGGGHWTPQALGPGYAFVIAVHDLDGDGKPDLHALTEGGDYSDDRNLNTVYLNRGGRTWKVDDLGSDEEDPRAYLGGLPATRVKGTPMGLALWDLEADGEPECWLSQGERTSPIFRREAGTWRSVRARVPGIEDYLEEDWKAREEGTISNLFYWGAVAVDLDGNGLDDLALAESAQRPEEAMRLYGLTVMLHQGDRIVRLPVPPLDDAGLYGLTVAPLFGPRPDLLAGGSHTPPRVLRNALDSGPNRWIVLKLLGRGGESATVEIAACGHTWTVYPSDHAGPRGSSPPWVVRGIGDCNAADVTVTWAGGSRSLRGVAAGAVRVVDLSVL